MNLPIAFTRAVLGDLYLVFGIKLDYKDVGLWASRPRFYIALVLKETWVMVRPLSLFRDFGFVTCRLHVSLSLHLSIYHQSFCLSVFAFSW